MSQSQDLDQAFAQLNTMSLTGHAYRAPAQQADNGLEIHMVDPANDDANKPKKAKSKTFSLNPFKSTGRVTKDGQPAKKRGPKPDSRPAATRRQALNRQAQRTHRERKELYTRDIEKEVVRLREFVATMARQQEVFEHENCHLKQILLVNGIPFERVNAPVGGSIASAMDFTNQLNPMPSDGDIASPRKTTASSQAFSSRSTSHDPSISPPPRRSQGAYSARKSSVASGSRAGSVASPNTPFSQSQGRSESFLGTGGMSQDDANMPPSGVIDVEQIGIDFVLDLERTCYAHKTFMGARTFANNTEDLGGHAMMMTCPPSYHLISKPHEDYPHQMPDAPKSTLARLINMSGETPRRGGELTPALAWKLIRQDERFSFLSTADCEKATAELTLKCRCYGWGAVVEEYEVHDVLEPIYRAKPELREYFSNDFLSIY